MDYVTNGRLTVGDDAGEGDVVTVSLNSGDDRRPRQVITLTDAGAVTHGDHRHAHALTTVMPHAVTVAARRLTEAAVAAADDDTGSITMMSDAREIAWLTADALDPAEVLARVGDDPAMPGRCVFVGTVRADADIREVVMLEYEAYADMALHEMDAICMEAGSRFGARCAMAHRTGSVAVGEPSVAAAAAAPSDEAALDACEWMVDQMKVRVPVWKRQRFADGGSEWTEGA